MRIALACLALLHGLASPAAARDAIVTSADGTPIVASFFPAYGLQPGQKAPTILMTHGWGGNRDTTGDSATSEATGNVGAGPLRRAGFNVLTWDSRGFGQSGGTVTVGYKDNEGRDVQALLDYVAKQHEAQLDGPGDPRVGMTRARSRPRRRGSSARRACGTGNLDPHITSAFVSGASTGKLSAEDRAWFDSRGPAGLVDRIRVPTLLIQGTADTPVHARRGDRQLRDPPLQRRAGQDGVVLRRPRGLPHGLRPGRAPRPGRDRVDEALPGG